jgi:selenocysteine-specific elongation factor
MPFVIGTAGHIDHGKTSLIKALTGQDTDRLKEEKERGISIDLGFAYLDLPDGTRAGIVDVPGHERFIRNMLAGAHGIDLVLFTVAADDGVMPQTEEHFDIVHLLKIPRALFVVTKTDLVSDSRIRAVQEEIEILTSGTALDRSPIVPFSFVTGEGLDAIRIQIGRMLQETKKPAPEGYFRLPVDRAFVLQGHGLIVTGTALSGTVTVGQRVRSLPGGQLFRVRSLQVHNRATETASWGQRIALNLSGEERSAVGRGHTICHERITLTSERFDAWLELRSTAAKGVKNQQRVRVHAGTAERLAKVILLGTRSVVGPKESSYCQIVPVEPLVVLRGDRFILRDETAQRTIGGGMVIHPCARTHRRTDPGLPAAVESLHRGEFPALVEALLSESNDFAVPVTSLIQLLNLTEEHVRARLPSVTQVRAFNFEEGTVVTTAAKWQRLRDDLLHVLDEFHRAHPLLPGMEMEAAREKLRVDITPRLFRAFIEQLEAGKVVARDANLLRHPNHTIQLRQDEQRLVERIIALLSSNPLTPPDAKQIEQETGVTRSALTELIHIMERERSIVRVAPELYFLREAVDRVRSDLYKHLAEKGSITPIAFRDLFGTSRKYTIPLLEFFDREGLTIRVGDTRRLRQERPA